MGFIIAAGVVGLLAAVALGVRALVRASARLEEETARRIASARLTEATIARVETAPMQDGYRRRTTLHVTLTLDDGAEVHGFWSIDTARVGELAVGARVPARVDAPLAYPAQDGVEHDIGNAKIWAQRRPSPPTS